MSRATLAVMCCLLVATVSADQISIPHPPQANTQARAADMKANLDALVNESNAQDQSIKKLEQSADHALEIIGLTFNTVIEGEPYIRLLTNTSFPIGARLDVLADDSIASLSDPVPSPAYCEVVYIDIRDEFTGDMVVQWAIATNGVTQDVKPSWVSETGTLVYGRLQIEPYCLTPNYITTGVTGIVFMQKSLVRIVD